MEFQKTTNDGTNHKKRIKRLIKWAKNKSHVKKNFKNANADQQLKKI